MPTSTAAKASLSNAAHKAWATRRARALAAGAAFVKVDAPVAVLAAVTVPGIPLPVAKPVEIIHDDKAWMKPATVADKAIAASARDVFVPATRAEMIELYIDDAAIGCGFRRLLVLEKSERMVRLFCAPKLCTIVVSAKQFAKARTPRFPLRKRVLVDVIQRNRAMIERLNDAAQAVVLEDGGAYADRALALLTA